MTVLPDVARPTAGALIVTACSVSWGLVPILVREVELPALVVVFFRVLLSAAFLAALLALSGRRRLLRRPPPLVLALGVLLAVHWSLFFAALGETSVASAVLVTYAAPILMVLLAPPLIDEHVPPSSLAALALAGAGIALITLSGGEADEAVRALGVALALGAALSMALLIVLLKRWAADVPPATTAIYQDLTASVLLLPAALLADYSLSASDLGYLVILGAVLTGAAGFAYVAAIRWLPATTTGTLMYVEPVSAALLAALLLGERLTPAVLAGGALIVAGGITVALRLPTGARAQI